MATGLRLKMVKQFINQSPKFLVRLKGTHAIKYDVHYWNAKQNHFVDKNAFIQIVPSVNPLTLRKGDTYEIKCLKMVNHMRMHLLSKI